MQRSYCNSAGIKQEARAMPRQPYIKQLTTLPSSSSPGFKFSICNVYVFSTLGWRCWGWASPPEAALARTPSLLEPLNGTRRPFDEVLHDFPSTN